MVSRTDIFSRVGTRVTDIVVMIVPMSPSKIYGLLLVMCVSTAAQGLPSIGVLSTGGTIASRQDQAKAATCPPSRGEDLVAAVPAIKKIAQIQVEQISNIPSPDVTPEIWLLLAGRINELLQDLNRGGRCNARDRHAGGNRILSGPDNHQQQTGNSGRRQYPASDPDSDGPKNLLDAIRVATAPEAVGKGAIIVMNGQINAARDVTKTNTSQVETFEAWSSARLEPLTLKRSDSTVPRCDVKPLPWIPQLSLGASKSS